MEDQLAELVNDVSRQGQAALSADSLVTPSKRLLEHACGICGR